MKNSGLGVCFFGLMLCFVSFTSVGMAFEVEEMVVVPTVVPCNNVASPNPCIDDGLGGCGATLDVACHATGSSEACSWQPTARGCKCSNVDP